MDEAVTEDVVSRGQVLRTPLIHYDVDDRGFWPESYRGDSWPTPALASL